MLCTFEQRGKPASAKELQSQSSSLVNSFCRWQEDPKVAVQTEKDCDGHRRDCWKLLAFGLQPRVLLLPLQEQKGSNGQGHTLLSIHLLDMESCKDSSSESTSVHHGTLLQTEYTSLHIVWALHDLEREGLNLQSEVIEQREKEANKKHTETVRKNREQKEIFQGVRAGLDTPVRSLQQLHRKAPVLLSLVTNYLCCFP